MAREFRLTREIAVANTPREVFDAVSTGTAGWLWPTEFEHRVGGRADMGGTVTAWDPPHRFTTHVDGPGGFFNDLDNVIEARTDGGATLRYVHSGIFTDDWDTQYDAANKHTDFYLHTLEQYLRYFAGRRAAYATADGPAASATTEGLARAVAALGLTGNDTVGSAVRLDPRGVGPVDAVVDYRTEHFLGLRTDGALYRVFARGAWGMPVSVSLHLFDGPDAADPEKAGTRWTEWLAATFA